jgi:excisionase family DNA binding protein
MLPDHIPTSGRASAPITGTISPPPSAEANRAAGAHAEPLLVTADEAARLLAVSPRTLWSLTDAGEILPVRIGRSVRYSVGELQAFVRRRLDAQRGELPRQKADGNGKANGQAPAQ